MRSVLRTITTLAWSLALGLTSTVSGDDWPTFMHDATRVGHTTENLPTDLVEQWVVAAPAAPKRAWPGPQGEVIENLELRHRVRFDDAIHVAMVGPHVFFCVVGRSPRRLSGCRHR